MSKPKLRFGNVAFWLVWPAVYVYLRPSHRTRLLVIADNKLLVVMDRLGRRQWSIPGGGRHNNESSVNSALRELREETGVVLEPSDLKPLSIDQWVRESGFRYIIDSFWVKLPETLPLKAQAGEIYATKWLPIENLIDGSEPFSKTGRGLLGIWLEQHHLLN